MGYRSEVAYGVKVDDIEYNDKATEEEKSLSADGIFLLMLTEMQQDPIAGKCFDDTYDINEYLTINTLYMYIYTTIYTHNTPWVKATTTLFNVIRFLTDSSE